MKSWISIILALIFLSAVVIFNIKKPKDFAIPKLLPTATPKLTPTPTIPPNSCVPTQLQATITFEGAAGSIYGTAKLTNTSKNPCVILLNQQLQLAYLPTIKNVTVNYTGKPTGISYTLEPKGNLYALVRLQNGPQCQSPIHQVQASLNYEVIPGQMVTFMNGLKPDFLINACTAESDLTQVDIASLSATPVQ